MSNNKDFKVKNGIKPTVYHEGVGTVTSGTEGYNFIAASDTSNVLDISTGVGTNPLSIRWKPDGLKLFVLSYTTDTLYTFTLTSAYDLNTATIDSASYNFFTTEASNPLTLHFNNDGSKFYVPAYTAAKQVYQYSLSTPYDLGSESYDGAVTISSVVYGIGAIAFKSDGTRAYFFDNYTLSNKIWQYDLSTAWDVTSTLSNEVTLDISSIGGSGSDLLFDPDGSSFFVTSGSNIIQYDLSTAWDVSTATQGVSFDASSIDSAPRSPNYNSDGTRLFFSAASNREIRELNTEKSTATLDLSTGSVFEITPTSDIQMGLSNPAASGTVSAATLLLTSAEATGVGSTFSTTLYTGTGAARTITNGIDLATDGGLVWIKNRTGAYPHYLVTTPNGFGWLYSNTTDSIVGSGGSTFSFNSDGWTTTATGVGPNGSGQDYVSWTFKKAAGFFDIVTYTGDGVAGRQIAHNLGTTVGTIIIKCTSSARNWRVWHRDILTSKSIILNSTAAVDNLTDILNSTTPTDSVFTVSADADVNNNGFTYVAYLFAHDTASDGQIQCGSYTGNGSTTGPTINLGWEPQWVLVKQSSTSGQWWQIIDTQRGFDVTTGAQTLGANSPDPEYTNAGFGSSTPILSPTSTGFQVRSNQPATNAIGETYIYIAIRAPYVPIITYDPDLQWSGGTAPTAPAIGETDVITINTDDGGTTYKAVQAIDGAV